MEMEEEEEEDEQEKMAHAEVLELWQAGLARLVRDPLLCQEREGGIQHISWKYVWRTYSLSFFGEKLDDDQKKLRECGIRNRDEVTFVKKLRK
nr:U11/U12 small nuclear ribonucleoprotein 25 kDa protein [Pogona vitticeps]